MRRLCFALVLASGTLAGLAAAQDSEALIRQGIEHRRADRNVEALQVFQEAYELQKTPRVLAQIGTAEQALGRWGAADRHLRQAIESANDPWIRKNRVAIDEALRVIGDHVGRLDVTGTPVGAEVRVDGEVIGRLPFPAPISVTAGGVAIEVRAAGHLPIVRAATVSVGVLVRESFNLQSLLPVPEPASTPASPSGSAARARDATDESTAPQSASARLSGEANTPGTSRTPPSVGSLDGAQAGSPGSSDADHQPGNDGGSFRRIITLGVAGLAVAALVVGIVEHVTWQGKVTSFGNMVGCDGSLAMRGASGCQRLYSDGESAKKLAFVGYGVGAGLAATAAILFFTEPPRSSESPKLACAVNPLGPGIGCGLRF